MTLCTASQVCNRSIVTVVDIGEYKQMKHKTSRGQKNKIGPSWNKNQYQKIKEIKGDWRREKLIYKSFYYHVVSDAT